MHAPVHLLPQVIEDGLRASLGFSNRKDQGTAAMRANMQLAMANLDELADNDIDGAILAAICADCPMVLHAIWELKRIPAVQQLASTKVQFSSLRCVW